MSALTASDDGIGVRRGRPSATVRALLPQRSRARVPRHRPRSGDREAHRHPGGRERRSHGCPRIRADHTLRLPGVRLRLHHLFTTPSPDRRPRATDPEPHSDRFMEIREGRGMALRQKKTLLLFALATALLAVIAAGCGGGDEGSTGETTPRKRPRPPTRAPRGCHERSERRRGLRYRRGRRLVDGRSADDRGGRGVPGREPGRHRHGRDLRHGRRLRAVLRRRDRHQRRLATDQDRRAHGGPGLRAERDHVHRAPGRGRRI